MQRERERARSRDDYDALLAFSKKERDRSLHGEVVVHGRDVEWAQNRQSRQKMYLRPSRYSGISLGTCLDDWRIFVQDIKAHSGKHRHQGGLVIYVLEGEGYTVVEGERHDWEAGDLLLLPLKTGGVEHQHFNVDESKPAKWVAFINAAIKEWSGSEMVQIEQHPDFHENARH